jgi:cytochrome c oxidase subunit 2
VTRRRSLLLFIAPVALAGCGLVDNAGKKGNSEQGRSIFDLWHGTWIAAFVVGGIVWALIFWVVVRYRRRNDEIPSQRQYILPIEIVYTVTPVLIVAVLFVVAYNVQRDVNALSSDPDLVIRVDGFQWQWQFTYVDEDITVTGLPDKPPVMVLPVGETVRLRLRSHDVIHSFYVPDFLYKRDVIPGVNNDIDIDVTDEGTYTGRCAEFCGLDHAKMTFEVEAVSPAEFRQWVTEQQGDRAAREARASP